MWNCTSLAGLVVPLVVGAVAVVAVVVVCAEKIDPRDNDLARESVTEERSCVLLTLSRELVCVPRVCLSAWVLDLCRALRE